MGFLEVSDSAFQVDSAFHVASDFQDSVELADEVLVELLSDDHPG